MCKGKIEDDADCDLKHQQRRNGAREKLLCGRSQHSRCEKINVGVTKKCRGMFRK